MGDQSGTEAGLLWILLRAVFRAEFVAKFLTIKAETKIYGLRLDFFQGRVWPKLWSGMTILCEMFLCVIAGNLITRRICV